ncbi:hypothetical protein M427DRAFT_152105 [Gonapodya prolifera JEL478]|uniref:Swiss Army Knife RNA repair protein HAD domain-containing protein n=1 Tax=Gonapodya prolifera (strain JEL478) TaxID=1344416 RepID=A0A139ATZ3_GONPJ|nr:hypothetical protein M427DRAFT_152105 [Gonapodya prolifera JEL478]|eukprot:KXS20210.1 hypothetical protein M427DRAFT_152105 [Gonapodya prolifera JEL478]
MSAHVYDYETRIAELASQLPEPPTRLTVVDFDGTLFRSPLPNPSLFHPALVGHLMSDNLWFQDTRSISPPFLPASPDLSWFDPSVVDAVRKARSIGGSLVILLTGRRIVMLERVRAILQCLSHSPLFDLVLLREAYEKGKPYSIDTTLDYKLKVLASLLKTFPTISQIDLYDDRTRHLRRFEEEFHNLVKRRNTIPHIAGATLGLASFRVLEVAHHPHEAPPIPHDVETSLVQQILNEAAVSLTDDPKAKIVRGESTLTPINVFVSLRLDKISRDRVEQLSPTQHGWAAEPMDFVLRMGAPPTDDDGDGTTQQRTPADELSRLPVGTAIPLRLVALITVPGKAIVAVAAPELGPSSSSSSSTQPTYLLTAVSAVRSHGVRISKEISRLKRFVEQLVTQPDGAGGEVAKKLQVVFSPVPSLNEQFRASVHHETRLGLRSLISKNASRAVDEDLQSPAAISLGSVIMAAAQDMGVVLKGRDIGEVKSHLQRWMEERGIEDKAENEAVVWEGARAILRTLSEARVDIGTNSS